MGRAAPLCVLALFLGAPIPLMIGEAQAEDAPAAASEEGGSRAESPAENEPFQFTMREWGFYEPQTGWGRIPAAVLRFPDDRPGLDSLDQLRGNERLCIEVHAADESDPVLEKIAALDNIRILQVVNSRIPDAQWKHLAGHSGLCEIMAANVEVRAAGLAHIAAVPNLEWLMLNSLHIDDEAVQHLARARNLKLLSLRAAPVTDAGMVHFSGLSKLQDLSLPDSRLTDAGLAHLKGLNKLNQLDIDAEEAFTATGVLHLKDLQDLRDVRGIPDGLVSAHLPHVARHRTEHELRNTRIPMSFIETPLEDACADLGRLISFEFAADDDVRERRITLQLRDPDVLSGLEVLCELYGLAWTLESDRVQLSSREVVRGDTETRTYDLAEMLGAKPEDAAEMARVIPMVVAPESWSAGSAASSKSVTVDGSRLTVVQSPDVQREVKRLLDDFGERGIRHPSASERQIVELLDGPATLKVRDMRLNRLLSDFPDRRLSLVLDLPAFTEHGIATDVPVTVEAGGIPLSRVLDLIFDPHGLAWTVRHDVVVVFPDAKETKMLEPRVYHIGGILTKGETSAYAAERVRDELAIALSSGRYVADAFNRVVVRASFREHQAVRKLLDQLAQE